MNEQTRTILRYTLLGLLVLWGGYTLLYYLGVPVHQTVLLTEAARQAADCGPDGGNFCRGISSFLPFIARTFQWAAPFMAYTIVSIAAFAALVMRRLMKDGRWELSFTLTPLTIILSFVASLWAMFTILSVSDNAGMPYSRLYEPTPQIYSGVDVEGYQVLQENFRSLMDRGCLREVPGVTPRSFDVSQRCMQASFLSRVMPHAVLLLGLILVMLSLGRFLLGLLRMPLKNPLTEAVFSVGLGAGGLLVILWLIALIGGYIEQPIYSQVMGWALLLLLPAALYRHTWYWIRSLTGRKWIYEEPVYAGALIIGWLLVSYLALNYLNVVRPFPIGWDDLGRYLNMPRLLVSYGYFIPQMAVYQWEYMTSLGFLLFGYESIFGATFAMMINWMAGLLAVLVVYAFGRIYLGPSRGLLAALLYYALPLVGHFSFADMKVDNAVFFMGSLAALAVCLAMFPGHDEEDTEEERVIDWKWMVIAGVIGGVAFSLKPTVIMTLMGLGALIFGAGVHWSAFIGTVSLAWLLYTLEGRFNVPAVADRVYGSPDAISKTVVLIALLIMGVGLTAYSAYLRPKVFRRVSVAAGVFIAAFIVTIVPWLITNNIAYGNAVPKLVFTAPNNLAPVMEIGKGEEAIDLGKGIRSLPPELRVDMSKCVNTAKNEELDRYWGDHSGWTHYLMLPWRSVMDLDSAGYYVTTIPALLLLPLLLLLPYFWTKQGRWLRWFTFATAFMLVQWVFFGNGIGWYGLGMFLGFVIGLEALVYRSPDAATKTVSSLLIALSLFICFAMRFWQYDQQRNLFEYPLGKVTYEAMRERTIPHYDDIREIIEERAEEMPERPYVYRIGTFIPYFLPKNLEVMPVSDHQLDFFNCLHQERDPQLTIKRLQALGFNSIIFDTNTHTIEKDQNGSLHQKVGMFVDFVNTPGLGFRLPINDVNGGVAFILLP